MADCGAVSEWVHSISSAMLLFISYKVNRHTPHPSFGALSAQTPFLNNIHPIAFPPFSASDNFLINILILSQHVITSLRMPSSYVPFFIPGTDLH